MMKIPYQMILHSKTDYDDFIHNKNNVILRWIYTIYWKSTKRKIIKLLRKSGKYINDITKNDIIMFGSFAVATRFYYDYISVAVYDSRYIITFKSNDYIITVDTGTNSKYSYYLIEDINGKTKRTETTNITTSKISGLIMYNMILDFITEYLMA